MSILFEDSSTQIEWEVGFWSEMISRVPGEKPWGRVEKQRTQRIYSVASENRTQATLAGELRVLSFLIKHWAQLFEARLS